MSKLPNNIQKLKTSVYLQNSKASASVEGKKKHTHTHTQTSADKHLLRGMTTDGDRATTAIDRCYNIQLQAAFT
jgi:FlaG/FlaF family flagellin (archaellin)